MDISKITSLPVYKNSAAKVNEFARTVAEKVKDEKVNKIIKGLEPNGKNHSFGDLAVIMLTAVLAPRVLTAAKRNPSDKEGTKDEILEIVWRDIPTILVMLFALKALNTTVAGLISKKGSPLRWDKGGEQVFNGKNLKENLIEFINEPKDKIDKIWKNLVDAVNPVGGNRMLTNDEFIKDYSNFKSIAGIKKMFNKIKVKNGKPEKIFDRVINDIIKDQKNEIEKANILSSKGIDINVDGAKDLLNKFKKIKDAGLKALDDDNLDENVKKRLIAYFEDPNNSLVTSAKKTNAALRTGVLAAEIGCLGFGIPHLNQLRLEKKYLKKDKNAKNNSSSQKNEKPYLNLIEKTPDNLAATNFKQFLK